jgi:hypothetical protein
MAHIVGTDRTQAVLLPEVLDDYVTADNPVRFLDAFVAQLDLPALGATRRCVQPNHSSTRGSRPLTTRNPSSTEAATGPQAQPG